MKTFLLVVSLLAVQARPQRPFYAGELASRRDGLPADAAGAPVALTAGQAPGSAPTADLIGQVFGSPASPVPPLGAPPPPRPGMPPPPPPPPPPGALAPPQQPFVSPALGQPTGYPGQPMGLQGQPMGIQGQPLGLQGQPMQPGYPQQQMGYPGGGGYQGGVLPQGHSQYPHGGSHHGYHQHHHHQQQPSEEDFSSEEDGYHPDGHEDEDDDY